MKSLGSLTTVHQLHLGHIYINSNIFSGKMCCLFYRQFVENKTSISNRFITRASLPYLWTLFALSDDIIVLGVLSRIIEMPPEEHGDPSNTEPSENRSFSHKRGDSVTGA